MALMVSSGKLHEAFAEAAYPSGVLDQRQTGTQRRGAADGHIGRRRHGKADRGKAENEMIGFLAHREMLALAEGVPDVAPDEDISGHRAGEARHIVGIAGDEAGGKTLCRLRGGIVLRDRIADTLGQLVAHGDIPVTRQLGKAAGEIGIASGERGLDIGVNKAGIVPQSRIKLQVGELGRLVPRRQQRPGVACIRP
jgi:hypothetical protein